MDKKLEHRNNALEEYQKKKKTDISSEMKRIAEKSITEDNNAEESKKRKESMDELIKYYISYLQKNTHTLEQVIWLSFVELYAKEDPQFYIRRAREAPNMYDAILPLCSYASWDAHVKTFYSVIDGVLKRIFGKEYGINIFAETNNKNMLSYEINDEEMRFLLFLLATHKTEDYIQFETGNYKGVSIEYFDQLRFGAELLSKRTNPRITKEQLDKRFNIGFNLYQKKIEDQFEVFIHLINEMIGFKIGLDKTTAEQEECFKKCLDILKQCETDLMDIRKKLYSTDCLDINQIIANYKKKLLST